MRKLITFVAIAMAISLLITGCTAQPNNVTEPNEAVLTDTKGNSNSDTAAPTGSNSETSDSNEVEPADHVERSETAVPTIPELTSAPYDLPENDALAFVQQMKIGWNLGNTFDANTDHNISGDEMAYETMWVGVKTSQEMIDALKEAGFNTVRIPVSWHNHVDENYSISKPWLDRVQEVVDYAYDKDMYVILNIHHDILPNYYYPSSEHLDTSKQYVTSIWTQLSERFGDYGHHLIFESVNEPRLRGTEHEWWLDLSNEECLDAVESINVLNQTFVDTVRASGGLNGDRYLMVPSYAAAADYAVIDPFRLPDDSADNRIIVSVHAYTPYNFALQSPIEPGSVSEWGVDDFGSTGPIDSFMDQLYDKYTSQGIPVVLGEFGARDKNGNLQDRIDYAAYYIHAAGIRGMIACWWDNHSFTGDGENFGLLDRKTAEWRYPDIVSAMMKYA